MSKIAINGLGRIGRTTLRAFIADPPQGVELVGANDLMDPDELVYLIRHDSVYRQAPFSVNFTYNEIEAGGHRFRLTNEKDPARLPWKDLGVDIVLECTGHFRKRADSAKHLEAGASKVIISAPSDDADITIVLGANEARYDPEKHHVVSNASCTTNSMAPAIRVLNDAFGIEYMMASTVHAYTASQTLVDTVARKRRRGRAAAVSIVPTTTGAARAVSRTIPELEGKMDAVAMRIPVIVGSISDIVVLLKKEATVEDINAAFRDAASSELRGILEYTEEEIVSADIVGNPHSGIVDAASTRVIQGKMAKVLVWYDNEWAYSKRMVDLAAFMLAKMPEAVSAR